MIRILLAPLAALVLAGCASDPTRFYALSAPGPAAGTRVLPGPTVAVGPVVIPDALDRPQIVLEPLAGAVRVDDFSRWAAPLRSEITRALVDQLAALRPDAHVAPAPTSPATPDYRITVDVRRFELVPAAGTTLDAVWTLSANGKPVRTARAVITEPVGQDGIEPLVIAQSRAVERLAREIAAALPAAQSR